MGRRLTVLGCLVFSGLAALVYQVLWTRLLGLAFGHTTESIGTVLAVFFGGLALGNAGMARCLRWVTRPLRGFALLELGIGLYALLSLPVLRALPELYAAVAGGAGPGLVAGARLGLSGAPFRAG